MHASGYDDDPLREGNMDYNSCINYSQILKPKMPLARHSEKTSEHVEEKVK